MSKWLERERQREQRIIRIDGVQWLPMHYYSDTGEQIELKGFEIYTEVRINTSQLDAGSSAQRWAANFFEPPSVS